MRRRALLLALAVTGFAYPQAEKDREIIAAEAQWVDALKAGNREQLGSLLADDLVYTHSTGVTESKSEFTQKFKPDIQSFEYSDRRIKVMGDAAVLTATATISGAAKGESYQAKVRVTHVWMKNGGRWQLQVHQSTWIR
jgi:uncharacterized protein (TIGR02246 family)